MISILTTVRTGVQFLPECAASIEAQTYRDWEWLIGVNGFPTHSAIYHYARSFSCNSGNSSRVRVFDLSGCQNRPQASHALLGAAQGDLIAIHDVDDRWAPEKLARQIKVMEDLGPTIGVCGTFGRYFGDPVNGEQNVVIPIKPGFITYAAMLECNHLLHSSVLMRREHCRWPDTDLLDDYPLWLDLLCEGVRMVNFAEVLTYIRVHPDQYFAGARDNSAAIREAHQCLLP